MKTIKGSVLALAIAAVLAIQSRAVVDQTIAIQGTNIVLSWPSQGYEYYMIQYWPDLQSPSIQLTNCVPANSTNRTTFVIPCCTMAGLGGGDSTNSGGNLFPGIPMGESEMSLSGDSSSDLWVVQNDGGVVPLKIFPPGTDTNGMTFTDTPPDGQSESTPSFSANSFGGAAETPAGLTDGGCDCPAQGFFRVWHIPDFPSSITNYIFNGPTFIPIDYKDYLDKIDAITVLINGEPTPYTEFTYYVDGNGETNWGAGFYSDRLANGTNTIQLLTTLRLSDVFDGNTPLLVLSNVPQMITIGNDVTFTNWDDLILSNTYAFRAQSTTPNVDWEIDIYDVYGDFVNSETGHSDDGTIEWDWDLTDYWGNSRADSDADPDFYPYIIIDPSGGASPNTPRPPRPMPVVAAQYPNLGSWIVCYLDNFQTDGVTNAEWENEYMTNAMNTIAGGPSLWSIPVTEYPIKFGTNYTTPQREDSWTTLKAIMFQPTSRNFYYSGHGWATGIGGDFSITDGSNFITGSINFPRSKAKLESQWVYDNITFNKNAGARPYRFVWLDGC